MFHVVVVHNNQQRNVQKSVLQKCFWPIRRIDFFFFCRSRCRRHLVNTILFFAWDYNYINESFAFSAG